MVRDHGLQARLTGRVTGFARYVDNAHLTCLMELPANRIGAAMQGNLDIQRTLGTRPDVPVGLEVEAPDVAAANVESLIRKSERYCVARQGSPRIETSVQ